jgi:ankyrin repeat protein
MFRTHSPDPFDDIEDIELPEGVDALIFGDNNNHSLVAIEQYAQPTVFTLNLPSAPPPVVTSAPAAPSMSLHQAVLSGDANSVAQCISRPDVQINERDSLGYTPVHLAVQEKYFSIIIMLLNAGVDLSIPNINNRPAITSKFNNKDKEVVLQLWDMRDRITHPDHRQSMLSSCCASLLLVFLQNMHLHSNNILELLKSLKPDVAQSHLSKNLTFWGRSPLMLVCNQKNEYFELAKTIIDLASPDSLTLVTNKGETALHFAQINNHQRIVNYLTQRINPQQPQAMPEQTQPPVISEPEPAPASSPAPISPEPSEEEIDPFLQLKEQQKQLMQQLKDNQTTFTDCLEYMEKLKKLAEETIATGDNIRKNLQNVNRQIADHEKRADSLSTLCCDEESPAPGNSTVTHQYSKVTGHKRRIDFIDNDDEPEDEGPQNSISKL